MTLSSLIKTTALAILRFVKRIPIVRAFTDCTGAHWQQSALWAFANIVGSFMPIWGAFFLLRLHRIPFRLADFARHGELALYAAALVAPAVYQILKSMRHDRFPLRGGSVLIALVGVLIAAFIYAGTNPQYGPTSGTGNNGVDELYLTQFSAALLVTAFMFSFVVTLMDNLVNDPDLGRADRVNQALLSAAVAIDSIGSVHSTANAYATAEEPLIPTSEELGKRFNIERAQGSGND